MSIAMSVADTRSATSKMRSIVIASSVGTIIEWYDFLIYATAAALVFNKAFFPTFDPLAGTLAALGSYAVGFLARPLGGALFGHFGDRLGPQVDARPHHVHHGHQHVLHRPAAKLRDPLVFSRQSFSFCCASFRALVLAANGAAHR